MSSDNKRNETIWQGHWFSAGRHLAQAEVANARLSQGGHTDAFIIAKLVFQLTEQNLEVYALPLTIATYRFLSHWVSVEESRTCLCARAQGRHRRHLLHVVPCALMLKRWV